MRSILQAEESKQCYLCIILNGDHSEKEWLHRHHVFFGRNRKKSEEYGLTVRLCVEHHEIGPEAVHRNREIDMMLKAIAQEAAEEHIGHERFMQEFGKNYLEEERWKKKS